MAAGGRARADGLAADKFSPYRVSFAAFSTRSRKEWERKKKREEEREREKERRVRFT